VTRRSLLLFAVSLISGCAIVGCGHQARSYRSQGDALCTQLFHDERAYLQSASASDAGVDRLFGRFLEKAHGLPRPPSSLPGSLLRLDRAVRSAQVAAGDAAGSLWGLIGAARAEGLWQCGSMAVEALRRDFDAVQLGPAKPDRPTYVTQFQTLFAELAAKHNDYHAHPDPIEQRQRLGKAGPEDHGPGFVALLREYQAKVEQLGAPPEDERTVKTLLAFSNEGISRYAEGVVARGQRGSALFESGFAPEEQFRGSACLVDLSCP
jgi:hypothetical protein